MNGEYLGDGCYAEHDGQGVWLRAPRENGVHEIYLEPEVYRALREFWLRHFEADDNEEKAAVKDAAGALPNTCEPDAHISRTAKLERLSNAELKRLVGLAIEGYWTDTHAQPQHENELQTDYFNRVSLARPLADELLAILGDAL